MNILNRFKDDNDALSSSASGMQSFIEYASSYRDKIMAFTTNEIHVSADDVLSIPVQHDTLGTIVAYVTKAQYQEAMNDENAIIPVRINDAGETISISGAEILNNVESSAESLALQYEFCKLAISNSEITKQDFVTLIQAKYDGIAKDKLTTYIDMITEKDAVQSLKNLFSTYQLGGLSQKESPMENTFISISDESIYTGENVWIVALTNIGSTISGFFDVVWRGILHIGDFLVSIFDGLVKFGKWLLSKLFRNLTTNWDLSNSVYGIADIPLIQFPLCRWSYISEVNKKIRFYNFTSDQTPLYISGQKVTAYSWTHPDTLYVKPLSAYGSYAGSGMLSTALHAWLVRKLDDDDPVEYLSEVEIILPTIIDSDLFTIFFQEMELNPCDWSIRIGATQDGYVYLRVYPMLNPSWMGQVSDAKIIHAMYWSWIAVGYHYSHTYPCITPTKYNGTTWHPVPIGTIYWPFTGLANPFSDLPNIDDDGPIDLVSLLQPHFFNFGSWITNKTFTNLQDDGNPIPDDNYSLSAIRDIIYGFILPYAVMSSNALENSVETDGEFPSLRMFTNLSISEEVNIPSGISSAGTLFHQDLNKEVLIGISLQDQQSLIDLSAKFRPYSRTEMMPIIAHYQTLAEQAKEIERLIITIAVVTVAAFAAWKFLKFKRKRQNLLTIRQGNLDAMSWALGPNPSKEDLSNFRKAQKLVKRTSRLNGLLGVGTSNAITNSTFTLIGAVSEQIRSIHASDDVQDPITLESLKTLITG